MRRAWLVVLLVACSDDTIGVDAAVDATTDDAMALADIADVPDVEQHDCCPPKPDADFPFPGQEAKAFCNRLHDCCSTTDAAFDQDACVGKFAAGWENTNADFLVPGVIDSGHFSIDSTAAASCLAGVSTMTCSGMLATEHNMLTANCTAAVSGNSGVTGSCRVDTECISSAYCDKSSDAAMGSCVALAGQDAACVRTAQCAYKGGPGPLYCNGATCQPRLGLDAGCTNDEACKSGICANAFCSSTYDLVDLCPLPDGG